MIKVKTNNNLKINNNLLHNNLIIIKMLTFMNQNQIIKNILNE